VVSSRLVGCFQIVSSFPTPPFADRRSGGSDGIIGLQPHLDSAMDIVEYEPISEEEYQRFEARSPVRHE
jgi:hypothetical protein